MVKRDIVQEEIDRRHQLRRETIRALAPIGLELVRQIGNMATSVAQAGATSKMAAGASAVVLGTIIKPLDREAGLLLQAGGIAYPAVGAVADLQQGFLEGLGKIAEGFPFSGNSSAGTPGAVNITFDIADRPGGGGVEIPTTARVIEAGDQRRIGTEIQPLLSENPQAIKDALKVLGIKG